MTPPSTRAILGAGSLNAIAAAIAALAGIGITVVAGRTMAPAEYATFALAWGLIFGAATAVAAIEPEIARQQSLRRTRINREQLATAGVLWLGSAGLLAAVVSQFDTRLGVDSGVVGVSIVAAGSAITWLFVVRGYFAGRFNFRVVALLTLGEALARLGCVAALLLVGVEPLAAFVLGALFSALIGMPLLPRRVSWRPGLIGVRPTLVRVGRLVVGNCIAAALITGASVLVAIGMEDQPAEATGNLQAGVLVSRFPLMALVLVQAILVPVFTRRDSLFRGHDFVTVVTFTLSLVPVAAFAGWLGGPWLLSAIYGPAYNVDSWAMSVLAGGAAALGGIQVLVAVGVAGDRHFVAAIAYPAALSLTLCLIFVPWGDAFERVVAGYGLGPLLGLLVAVIVLVRARSRGHPEPVDPPLPRQSTGGGLYEE